MRQLKTVACVALACCAGACVPPTSNAPITKKYATAACIPLSAHPKVSPHARERESALTLRDGLEVIVRGAQLAGGRTIVSYPATGRDVVAADPGDYVYPSDVRLDAENVPTVRKLYGGVEQP